MSNHVRHQRLKPISSGQCDGEQRQPPATQTHLVHPTRRGTTPTTNDSDDSRPDNATGNHIWKPHSPAVGAPVISQAQARHNRISSVRRDGILPPTQTILADIGLRGVPLNSLSSGQCAGEQCPPPATPTHLVRPMRQITPTAKATLSCRRCSRLTHSNASRPANATENNDGIFIRVYHQQVKCLLSAANAAENNDSIYIQNHCRCSVSDETNRCKMEKTLRYKKLGLQFNSRHPTNIQPTETC